MKETGNSKKVGLYRVLCEVEPPHSLYEAILAQITLAQRRQAQWYMGLFGVITFISGVALVPAVGYVLQQLSASGFYQYSSLLFSDSSLVATNWQAFGLSLVESIPSLAVLLIIPIAAALVWSLKRTASSARIAFA